jgi:hypothetical protein
MRLSGLVKTQTVTGGHATSSRTLDSECFLSKLSDSNFGFCGRPHRDSMRIDKIAQFSFYQSIENAIY